MAAIFRKEGQTVYINNRDENMSKLTSDILEHLDEIERLKMDNYPILIIDDNSLMRGWNYRSKSGINLYLAKPFKTERDLT